MGKIEMTSPAPSEFSESNAPEYDLESFGIKETASSNQTANPSNAATPKPKSIKSSPLPIANAKLSIVQASLPSISAFENANKQQKEMSTNIDVNASMVSDKPIIHSEISSVASTPCSNKSGSA